MAKLYTGTKEFVEGFVGECYKRGFTEEQTVEMFDTVRKAELAKTGDPHFEAGVAQAVKSAYNYNPIDLSAFHDPNAGPGRTMGQGALTGGMLGGIGAMAAGGLMRRSGLAGGLAARGAGAALGRGAIGAGAGALGGAVVGSIPGLNHAGALAPVGMGAVGGLTLGSAAGMVGGMTGMGRRVRALGSLGALGGGLLGGLLGVDGGTRGARDDMANRWMPWIASGQGPSAAGGSGTTNYGAGSSSPGRGGSGDIFSVPTSRMDYYTRRGGGSYSGGGSQNGAAPGTPLGLIGSGNEKIKGVDTQLADIQQKLTSMGTSSDPQAQLEAMQLRREMNLLNRQRNEIVEGMRGTVSGLYNDQTRFHNSANNAYNDARQMRDRQALRGQGFMKDLEARDLNHWQDIPRALWSHLTNSEENARKAMAESKRMDSVMQGADNARNTWWVGGPTMR